MTNVEAADLLMGVPGVIAFISAGLAVALMVAAPFVIAVFDLGQRAHRICMVATLGLGSVLPLWLAAFCGTAVVLGDFSGHPWFARPMVVGFAAFSFALVAMGIVGIRRQLRSGVRHDAHG